MVETQPSTLARLSAQALTRLAAWLRGDGARVREAEELAAEARFNLEQIFRLTPAAMAFWRGPRLVFELVNPCYQAYVSDRPLLGKTLLEAMPELEGQGIIELHRQVWETGEPLMRRDLRAVHKRSTTGEPEERFYDVNYVRIVNSRGTPIGIYNHAMDVTERVLAQRKLEESEGRLKLALSNAKMGTWRVDLLDGRVTLSEEAQRIFGVTRDYDTADLAIREFIHPDDQAHAGEVLATALAERKPYSDQYRVRWPNGEVRWVNLRGQANYDEAGKPYSLTGVVLDITAMKQAEQELADAVRARDEFLSIASHELKTPLTSLKLQTQTYQRRIAKADASAYAPDRVNLFITQTDRELSRLNRLVDDMLDIARIRTGKLTVQPVPGRLCVMVEETLERMRAQFAAGATPLPVLQLADDGEGAWDPLRMEQVVNNLLTNAIRYGQGRPITVSLTGTSDRVHLAVADQGIGIPPELHERIFDRFERAGQAKEITGLGLGLFITRQIVEAHGGRIWVESTPGAGSTFHLDLPRTR